MPGGFSFPPGSNVGAAGVVQLASVNGTERVIVDNGGALLAETTTAAIAALGGATVSVLTYGAVGNGVTDDTAAIQKALDLVASQGGGTVFFPIGTYMISSVLLASSNTVIMGSGSASILTPNPNIIWTGPDIYLDPYFLITNKNYAASPIVDKNIVVRDMQLLMIDGVQIIKQGVQVSSNGHAIRFRAAQTLKVLNCLFTSGGDGAAFIGCADTLVQGCSAYEQSNCPYDHWGGTTDARVIGNYATSATAVQMVNFNGVISVLVPSPATTSSGIVIDGNEFHGTNGARSAVISLSPLQADCAVNDVIITNNLLNGVLINGKGNITNTVIANNVFINPVNDNTIGLSTDGTNTPSVMTITGNTIINPTVPVSAIACIGIGGNTYLVQGNTIVGGTYQVAINTTSFTGLIGVNNFPSGSSSITNGTAWSSVESDFLFPNNINLKWYDASGSILRILVDSGSSFAAFGTGSSGSSRPIWAMAQRSDTSAFQLYPTVEVDRASSNFIRFTGGAASASNANSPLIAISPNASDANVALRVAGRGTPGALIQASSITGPPTTTDIPAGYFTVAPDGGGGFKLYYNAAGSLKSVALA